MGEIRLRGDLAANWAINNPVLDSREPAVETDTGKFKIGDGITAWGDLDYSSGPAGPQGPAGEDGTGTGTVTQVSGQDPDDDGAVDLDPIYPRVTTPQAHGAAADGVTDDTTAIQAAIDSGDVVYFPPATYKTTDTLTITVDSTQLYGAGPNSEISYTGSSDAILVGSKTATSPVKDVSISRLLLQGTSSAASGLHAVSMRWSRLEQLQILGFSGGDGLLFDTQSSNSSNSATRSNIVTAVRIDSCENGAVLTKDADDDGTDGANFNLFFGLWVTEFTGIGIDIDAGEFNCFFGCDASSTESGTTGVRINDGVNCLFGIRADNSSGGVDGADATGIKIDDGGSGGYLILQPTGNGPVLDQRIVNDNPTAAGIIMRQGFNTWIGTIKRSLDETTGEAVTRAWKNKGTSTISANEIAYFDSSCAQGEVLRWNSANTDNRNLLVCVEEAAASEVGQFACPGSVADVTVVGAVDVGDTLVGSDSQNGAAMADNTETDPAKIAGIARTAVTDGGTVEAYIK